MVKKKVRKAASKVKKVVKNAAKKVKSAVKRSKPRRSAKQVFLYTYGREHAITLRVLRAFPPGTSDFRPHERSQSVSELAYTMLYEQELERRALARGPTMGGSPPPKPANFEAAIEAFDTGYRAIVDQLEKTPDSKLDATVEFPTAKGMMGTWPVLDFLWFMLHDQIHHRGQLSVMVRMAGGKVPSIYGPSGDEPWT